MQVNAFLLLVAVRTVLLTDPNCHISVLFHRNESLLPSTKLFCVIQSNQEALEEVPIIQAKDQWSKFAIENRILEEQQISQPAWSPILLRKKAGVVSEFHLPFSLLDNKCTGAQPVVLGVSQSVACSPSFPALTEAECLSNEFLSVQSLFGSPLVSVEQAESALWKSRRGDLQLNRFGNNTAETNFRWNSSLLPTQWKQSHCENVVKEISTKITLNETLVVDAELTAVEYATITAENYTKLVQEFHVDFKNAIEISAMIGARGYERGQVIYATNDDLNTFAFSLPQSGPCRNTRKLSVKFLIDSTSACTLRISQCTEVKQKIQRLIDEFVPKWIRSSPVDGTNITNVLVIPRNRTKSERSTDANCTIVTNFFINIYYAKKGTEANHHLLIVSTIYNMDLEAVRVTKNSTVTLRFNIHFDDVTPSPSSRFVSLPHIQLQLPNDFFYPFMEKSAAIVPLCNMFLAIMHFYL